MLLKRKNIFSFFALSSLLFVTSHSLAGDNIDGYVQNNTAYKLTVSVPWNAVWSLGNDTVWADSNSVPVGVETQVVSFNHACYSWGCSKGNALKVQGAYDVYDAVGNWVSNCSLSIQGFPGDFYNSSTIGSMCSGTKVKLDIKAYSWKHNGGGKYTFVISY